MLLVGSTNALVGFAEGMKIMRAGGTALDAVEATIRPVESNPEDHSVGYSGLPNILGEVELDASIMDGRTLESGAVCAVHGYEHVITLAKEVMLRLPHVLLAGAGAERFAKELGFKKRSLLSEASKAIYEGRVGKNNNPRHKAMRELVQRAVKDPKMAASSKNYHGTVDVIAMDANGNIASGVSTSGLAWKYPGRVGDSPIIGAGNYADNRYGACGCTGYGEMAIRCSTAHSVVLYMKTGMSLAQAAREAMKDLRRLTVPLPPSMNLVAIDAQGQHTALSTEVDREVTYIYQTDKMAEPVIKPRIVVSLGKLGNKSSRKV